ncbi:hypothetical protein [Lewinella sp. LCG006]|jgi:hypothetical protein|uniref:hypothetical protein n=1 Tax=Lewinella sp. LCG006 TaxID=3231911 RepID=UPI00345F1933
MEQLAALQAIIREESEQLICQTHPEVCALRDANYARLEELVIDRLLGNEEEEISVQTALAELEQELGHV